MSADFDPRLAEWLRQEAPVAIDRRVVERIVAETRAAPQRGHSILRFNALTAPIVGTAVVAVVAVLVVLLLPPFRSPSTAPATSVHPSESMPSPEASDQGASASSTPGTDPLDVWSGTTMPNPIDAYRGGIPEDAVAGGPGFVAVGGSSPCCADASFDDEGWGVAIWTSQDGSDWSLVPELGSFGKAGLSAIDVAGDGHMLSVGYDVVPPGTSDRALFGKSGTAWTSTNGADWIGVDAPSGQYEDVVWAGDRWVIGGSTDGRPALFTSTALGDWSTHVLEGYGRIAALAAHVDGRILAIGCVDADPGAPCSPATWVLDGEQWERIELDASVLYAAVPWQEEFVVTGMTADDVPRGMSWVLAEDGRWDRSARPDGIGDALAIAVDGNRLITGGSNDKLFESFDGLRWTPFAEPQLPDGAVEEVVRVLLPTDQRILALGEAFVTGAAPYVWIGER
jgi:hypothetical protein